MLLAYRTMAVVAVAMSLSGAGVVSVMAAEDAALEKRLAEEKEARRACKVAICKAFAEPGSGAPVACSFTKTWRRTEILARMVGGSYIWGYGHVQCKADVKLDREGAGKALHDGQAKLALGKHDLNCSVENKDAAKGEAFKVRVSLSPALSFKSGKVSAVDFGSIETEGSKIASAAITSAMALEQVSGAISGAATREMNEFLFEKCPADGIKLQPSG
jgi:hypothetical protein